MVASTVLAQAQPPAEAAAPAPVDPHAGVVPTVPAAYEDFKSAVFPESTWPLSGGQVFAKIAKAEGLAALFCSPGNYTIVNAIADEQIPVVSCRDERSGGHAADAFIRASGELAACSGTEGPGFTNMVTAIAEAKAARTPLLVLASNMQVAQDDAEAMLQMSSPYQQVTTEGMKKYGKRIITPNRIAEYAAYAFRHLRHGEPMPVHLDFPSEVHGAIFENQGELVRSWGIERYRAHSLPYPDPAAVQAAVDMIARAERPMIVASTGSFYSQAWEAIIRAAEKNDIAMVTSGASYGHIPADHRLSADAAPDSYASADLIIYVGQYNMPPAGEPGGFAFSPDFAAGDLPNASLSVPRVMVERRQNATLMHFNGAADEDPEGLVEEWTRLARELYAAAWPGTPATDAESHRLAGAGLPGADPEWPGRVRNALSAIEQSSLEKLVLTRRVKLPLPAEPDLDRVLEWLAARYPDAAVFAVRRPGVSLLGASPERLLGLEHGLVVADALAGSAPRAACDDADQRLGGTLLGDPKELAEHAVVVREILGALEPLCTALVASHAPSLLRLPNVQHLASHVHGRVRPEVGVFELLERMHPTPAVGGAPRAAALHWLREHGEADRGWYTGGVGWLDDAGGDVWVALRCAALRASMATLYAGAGIVSGSDPEQELRETGWKLQAMLEALAVG